MHGFRASALVWIVDAVHGVYPYYGAQAPSIPRVYHDIEGLATDYRGGHLGATIPHPLSARSTSTTLGALDPRNFLVFTPRTGRR